MHVEIYSDIVCPWCYVGEHRFRRALASFAHADQIEVVYRPYQLDPTAPATAVPHAEYMARRFGARASDMHHHVDAAAAGEGITIDWTNMLEANTRTAHRLLLLAEREHGSAVQRALVDRLFALHFTRGGDVADIEQLASEAAATGMDRDRVIAHLRSDAGVEALDAALRDAAAVGVRAVPTFVFGGQWAVEGAQAPETFGELLEEVHEKLSC
jgi:predicted DsbA family dithiol-disulfide isomerase